ncbi:MAG: flagellar biosynthetic protein FliO, partial [Oscillospiraceae bacterium]|nr:flagellar biosynthetic protein FliO [Oscillospiraceae bacterium]
MVAWLTASDGLTAPPAGAGFPIWGLLLFVAILAACWFGLRFLSRRGGLSTRGRHMQVLDRLALGRDNTLLLVRVAGRLLAVGVAKEGLRTLCELDADALTEEETPERPALRRFTVSKAPSGAVTRPAENRADAPQPEILQPETVLQTPRPESPAAPSAINFKGFWRRFTHNLGVYSGFVKDRAPARPDVPAAPEPNFSDMLARSQRVISQNPIAAEETPSASGLPVIREEFPASGREYKPVQSPSLGNRDYQAAIDQVRRYGQVEPNRELIPTALDNLAALKAVRAYATKQSQRIQENTADNPPLETPVLGSRGEGRSPDAAPVKEDDIDSLL